MNKNESAPPIGFWDRIIARLIAIAHRSVYKSVADALNLQPEDDYLEIGCGPGFFIKSYASHVESLEEIHRVLRPGGRLVVNLGWNADDWMDHTQ